MKALILVSDKKGHTSTFTEKQIIHIEIEDPAREGVLEFKRRTKRKKK